MIKNIAIDLHGTLNVSAELQKLVITNFFNPKFRTFILSGSPANEIKTDLQALFTKHTGVWKTSTTNNFIDNLPGITILSVVDTCKEFNIPMIRVRKANGELQWYCDDILWWPMKSIICKMNEIDILIDDKIDYLPFFGETHPTKFVRFPLEVAKQIEIVTNIQNTLKF